MYQIFNWVFCFLRSMNLLLTMSKDKKKLEKYQYKVKKFHADVIPGKSYHKVMSELFNSDL